MKNLSSALITILISILFLSCQRPGKAPATVTGQKEGSAVAAFGPLGTDDETIGVNPPELLQGKTLPDIQLIRTSKINAHAGTGIYPNSYALSPPIFGSVSEGGDWVSDVQFFVSNPYLLVLTSSASKVNALLPFCGVESVGYSHGKITAAYRGQSAKRWSYFVHDYYGDSYSGIVRLWFVNAWDAGFKFAHVDNSRSENLDLDWQKDDKSVTKGIYTGHEFFHVGHLAKNNISPVDPRARVRLLNRDERTVIYIKLWRQRPENKNSREDLAYVIVVEP